MKKIISLIITLILACAFTLTACGVPKAPSGYAYEAVHPVTRGDGYEDKVFPLYYQFQSENPSNKYEEKMDKLYFEYLGEIYYLQTSTDVNIFYHPYNSVMTVHKKGYDEIGSFVTAEKEGKLEVNHSYSFVFYNDGYLYYILNKDTIKSRYVMTGDSVGYLYSRYEEYRFNLSTGENESVDFELFFEKIQMADNTVKLNTDDVKRNY